MKLGEIVTRYPETFCELDDKARSTRQPMKGEVVYIHPQGRYHIVEFELRGGKVRESFPGVKD
nr:hypothetical protein [uncultured Oscillibacter sp.]